MALPVFSLELAELSNAICWLKRGLTTEDTEVSLSWSQSKTTGYTGLHRVSRLSSHL